LKRTYPTLIFLEAKIINIPKRKSSFNNGMLCPSRKVLRRQPDSNRRWRFCRPLPYHLAMAPIR
jgi:hypothetical protein